MPISEPDVVIRAKRPREGGELGIRNQDARLLGTHTHVGRDDDGYIEGLSTILVCLFFLQPIGDLLSLLVSIFCTLRLKDALEPGLFTTAAALPLHRDLKAAHGTALAFRTVSSTSPLPPA
jgi:hypothetical protein